MRTTYCPNCGGEGYGLETRLCPACRGTGKVARAPLRETEAQAQLRRLQQLVDEQETQPAVFR